VIIHRSEHPLTKPIALPFQTVVRKTPPSFEHPITLLGLNPAAMNTTLFHAIAILTLTASHPLSAQDSKSPTPQSPSPKTSNKLLEERKAAFAAATETVQNAYNAAASARQKHNIIDPDPEGAGAIVSPKDDPNVVEYVRLKDAYFKAKTEFEKAEEAMNAALPIDVLQAEVIVAESQMTDAFERIAEMLQDGNITDPNPHDSKSAVSMESKDVRPVTAYLNRKSQYLAFKGRAEKKRKALEAAKARKTPPSDVTK
jgi:hypothetical protein